MRVHTGTRPRVSAPAPARPQSRVGGCTSRPGTAAHEFGAIAVFAPERAEAADDDLEQTTLTGGASGNVFTSEFDPTTNLPAPDCDRIVITQSIRMTADGADIKPGTYYSPWACRDATTLSDGTYLDHGKCTYTTPYPVDRGIGTAGKSNASGTAKATYSDGPTTGGGDKGFKSAANPGGWSTVTYYFENYALCASGKECAQVSGPVSGPTWYDGVAWQYTKTAADAAAGGAGRATATGSLAPPGAGATIIQAFNKYNAVKGFVPC